jgi:lipoyl(octanoyl) transferase
MSVASGRHAGVASAEELARVAKHMSPPVITKAPALSTLDWGRTEYRSACGRQAELVERRIAGEINDTLVFTEHDPVFTVGMRRGAEAHLIWNATTLSEAGIALEKTNRGGDITYHGPGQIVAYPVISLAAHKDLHAYLRFLEQVLIQSLRSFGLTAAQREGMTGIWLGQRKLAAIGVAVRRWVTYHGFALNVDPDLSHFGGIVPCGIGSADGSVTSMRAELGQPVDLRDVQRVLAAEFRRLLPGLLERRSDSAAR